MNRPFSTDLYRQLPVVGILRGLPEIALCAVVQAVREGGLTNLEITMNTPDAPTQIRRASDAANGDMNIGAGTVTNLELLDRALDAGASFIVTPTVSTPVIQRCVEKQVPVFPGAFSPEEILRAWDLGATCVKVFPAEMLGPDYLRQLKDCFPHVQFMPTGGVDVSTLGAYAMAGAAAFGVGSPLFRAERIAASDWRWIRNQCRAFNDAYRAATEEIKHTTTGEKAKT